MKGDAKYPRSFDGQGQSKRDSIVDAVRADGKKWFIERVVDESVTFSVRKSSSSKFDNCFVKYHMDATRKTPPTLTMETSGC